MADVKSDNTYGTMLQREFNLCESCTPPNTATPENLAVLVVALRKMTDELERRRDEEGSDFVPDKGQVDWDLDMKNWKARLHSYEEALENGKPGDRNSVLWEVTSPLLLGVYGGPAGTWPPLPGRPNGQGSADANTPFMLSHAFATIQAWREERWNLLLDDLKKNASGVVDAAKEGIGAVLWIVGGVVVVGGTIAIIYNLTRK